MTYPRQKDIEKWMKRAPEVVVAFGYCTNKKLEKYPNEKMNLQQHQERSLKLIVKNL